LTRPLLFVARPLPVDPTHFVGEGIDVDVFQDDRPPTRDELLQRARTASGLVTLLSERIDGALLDALPNVQVVANVAVGFDNVDVAEAARRGIVVTNTPDVLTEATAELTFALLLGLARRLREGERMVRAGEFRGFSPTMLLGRELSGKTLGVFGFGRIGRRVGELGRAFGMRVLATARSPLTAEVLAPAGARQVDKAELLREADVLSIHSPLSSDTRHAFTQRELLGMKKGALLINTARGPIVDEASLVHALEAGHLGGAALDVYEAEPAVHRGLLQRDDVVLLPHLGSATWEARSKMAELALTDAARIVRGEAAVHPVPGSPSRPTRR
jgi:glyoxylate reductase